MAVALSFETATIVFPIATWVLFAALGVGGGAAVVMVFASLERGPRSVLRESTGEVAWSSSGADAAAARPAIAAADERAAKAEDAGFARGSLKASLAPRNIGDTGKHVLISRLSRFRGTRLDVLVDGGGPDALPLATMLCEALETAGWNVRIWQTSTARPVRGLLVQTRRGSDQTVQDPGVKLMLALQEVGLGARALQPFDPEEISESATDTFWKEKTAPMRLLVGNAP